MLKFIKSKDVRNFIEKEKIEFSDFEKAVIIYNSNVTLEEKNIGLNEIRNRTENKKLKKQIIERLSYDENSMEAFMENSNDIMYAVKIRDGIESYISGYFYSYKLALSYAKKKKMKFDIEKYSIIQKLNEHIEDQCDFDEEPIASISYDKNGNVLSYWTHEVNDDDKVNDLDIKRFENAYISMPNPFEIGDIVKPVYRNGYFGVVMNSQDMWKKFDEEMLKPGKYVDFSDASLRVDFLQEDGSFMHEHISPMFLERAKIDETVQGKKVIEGASELVRGVGAFDYFTSCYEDYRNSKKKLY